MIPSVLVGITCWYNMYILNNYFLNPMNNNNDADLFFRGKNSQ